MFRIKICGITCVEDALASARAGADAIGLNFYPRSPRYVSGETARQIMAVLPEEMIAVGLFVNTPLADVCRFCDDLQLDLIQLHGDEPPEYLALLGARPIMRAFRVGADGLQPVLEYLDRCRELAAMPRLTLLDSPAGAKFGGTGQTGDWTAAAQYVRYAAEANVPPLVLAGGLTPSNVAAAIQAVHPAAVDVASGVESSPGRKDPAAVEAFVQAAKSAF
jgi:phosphoribosylanthranilate isomerase